ncbi:MAG: hypothetical protein JSS43_29180 [Proteobacteria bacterium]|nr:hypothetical protein [Pseudomonadota bacterium]
MLLALGAAIGSYLGDIRGGYWGAGLGFAAGVVLVAGSLAVLNRGRTGG